jgi:hypothetical protein
MGKFTRQLRPRKLSLWLGLFAMMVVVIAWGRHQFHLRADSHAQGTPWSADQIEALRSQLAGDWVAKDVGSAIGPLKIEMILRKNGSCHVKLWTSGMVAAQIRDKEGAYELQGDRICSEILKRGSCKYWFEGQKLMLEYKAGTIVGFERIGGTGIGQTASAAFHPGATQR